MDDIWRRGIVALASYLLGGVNGALLVSRLFYRDDVRRHGSGNAGLTNFFRTYGAKYAALVILCDMLKAGLAMALGAWLAGPVLGRYLAALFCVLGHMFPVYHGFQGGKGILCGGMVLLCTDWRIALAGWGLFVLLTALTRYVSLGSVAAAASYPISTLWLNWEPIRGGVAEYRAAFLLSLLTGGLVIWAHRGNIRRLLRGEERRFHWHGRKES